MHNHYSVRSLLSGAALLLLGTALLHAQPAVDGFQRGAGTSYVALSYSHENYDTYWVRSTETQNPGLGQITTQSVSLYAVTGITSWLDLGVGASYIHAAPDAGTFGPQSGLQDLGVAVKGRAFEVDAPGGTLAGFASAGVSFPITDYVTDFPIAIGHGSTNLEGRLGLHYKSSLGVFATAQGGYIQRSNVTIDRGYEVLVPDAIDVSGTVGFLNQDFYAAAWVQRQNAQSGTDIGPGVPFPSNAQSFTRAGVHLYAPLPWVPELGVSLGFSSTLDGRNVGKATRISAGLAWKLPSWSGL